MSTLLLSAFLLVSFCFAQKDHITSWISNNASGKPIMPGFGRYGSAVGYDYTNERLWVFGGYNQHEGHQYEVIYYSFSSNNNTWTIAPFSVTYPIRIHSYGYAQINSTMYWYYNEVISSFDMLATPSNIGYSPYYINVSSNIYNTTGIYKNYTMIYGCLSSDNTDRLFLLDTYQNQPAPFYIYVISEGIWYIGNNTLYPHTSAACVYLNSNHRLYVFGGASTVFSEYTTSTLITSDSFTSWQNITDNILSSYRYRTATANGDESLIYLFGGWKSSTEDTNEV
eukprot:200755_1